MTTPVELRIGDQTYRLVSSSPEGELRLLGAIVDERLRKLSPTGTAPPAQRLLLVAMALAHDLEAERGLRRERDARWRQKVEGFVGRIDGLLGLLPCEPDAGEPSRARSLQPTNA
jgi:cell division protein ZapA